VEVSDITRYLKAKGASDKCPSCANEGWVFIGHGDANVYMGLPFSTPQPGDELVLAKTQKIEQWGRAVISMMCTNCAFVRSHDAWAVKQWVLSNPRQVLGA
jgi:hypothetical protein